MKRLIALLFVVASFTFAVNGQSYWTKARQRALADSLDAGANNSSWFSNCVRDAGGILKAVSAKSVVLAGPGAPGQFLITGKIIPDHEVCAYGARSPLNWIVEEDGKAFRVLADIGASDSVRVLGSTNNGYRDIRIGSSSAAGRQWDTAVLKFDGSLYKNDTVRTEPDTGSPGFSRGVGSGGGAGNSKTVPGGVLNEKAISLPLPAYPRAAKAIKATGAVSVKVVIDESGRVIAALADNGHPLLRASAENAAREARFPPTIMNGVPVKVSGIVIYSFIL